MSTIVSVRDMPRPSWAEVCARRLERHGLSVLFQDARPADVVAAICGAHAQAMSAAELSIGVQLTGITRVDVRDALWSERSGLLCFGPARGRKVTYTNPRRWLPGFRPADSQTALADLVKCYLHAYGPATPQQFAQWLNAPRRWAAKLFDSLASDLQLVQVDGTLAWVVAGDTAAPLTAPQGIRLLPYFDAYAVGCHPRERLYPGRAAERALAGGQGGNFPVLLIAGTVAGVWHHRRSGRGIEITVEPLAELTIPRRRDLDAQVERIGQFLEGTPLVTIGVVTAGGHA